MIRMIHRRLALLFALLLLLSALCPVSAWAEPDGENLSDLTDPLKQEDSKNPDVTDKKPVSEQDDQLQKKETDLSEDGKEKSADSGIEAKDEKASKETAAGLDGKVSAADGSEKTSRSKTNRELFISADGSDESGNGSYEAPFASLEAALAAADALGVDAELSLLSDLSISGTIQISGRNVYLTGNDRVFTITRDEGFNATEGDNALFAVGSPDAENNSGGQLILEHVILDEKGMKTNPVQDAMIEVYSGGRLILGEEAILFNYGGECAIHAREGSEVSLCPTAWILDTMAFEEDDTVAIREDEGSSVIRQAGCLVLSHGEVWEAEGNGENGNNRKNDNRKSLTEEKTEDEEKKVVGEEKGEKVNDPSSTETPQIGTIQKRAFLGAGSDTNASSSSIGFSFDAPKRISSSDDTVLIHSYTNDVVGYAILYELSLNLGSIIGTAGGIAGDTLLGASIHLTVTLDELDKLYPETITAGSTEVKLTPDFSVMRVASAQYSDRTIAVLLSTDGVENWKDHLDELKAELTLTLQTVVLADGTYPQKNTVTSSANVVDLTFSLGEGDTRTLTPSGVQDSATTQLLGPKTATLTYDPNEEDGGSGGPGTESLPAEDAHELETSNVPSHTDKDGYPVIFLGWTANLDRKIYSDKDTKPQTLLDTVKLEDGSNITVYAVYSYDKNEDGIPDVDQKLLVLGFDANGGSGAPDLMMKPGTRVSILDRYEASFDIPEQEPARKYYTFLGWSEDKNATNAKYRYNTKNMDDDILISEDTVLYAVWKKNPVYTLYFNGNGGTNVPAAQSAPSDNGVAELTITNQIPTRTGRKFVGWSTQRYGAAAFDPGEDVRITGGDVTLFAVWQRTSSWSGHSPKTGDESNIPLYAALAVGSAAAAFFIIRFLRKRGK